MTIGKRGVVLLFFVAGLSGCMAGTQLITSPAEPAAIQGNYTLFLYGCHYPDQIDNVAILVSGNAPYPFEIFDLDTSYKTTKNVPAGQALEHFSIARRTVSGKRSCEG